MDKGWRRGLTHHVDRAASTALNRICPYFTMFPLRFPYAILEKRAEAGDRVLDPFCGRGTTLYASRLLDLDSVGVDSSPVAAAIAAAKVVKPSPARVMRAFAECLDEVAAPQDVPIGTFWTWAYGARTLESICRIREALLMDCGTTARIALRAIILGALHGPKALVRQSHLSNQMPRSFSPKPDYSLRYWQRHELRPFEVDIRSVVSVRAHRYYGAECSGAHGRVHLGDSRNLHDFVGLEPRFAWIVTSPPYYGMRTYIPDQWLRHWFLGGPASPDYSHAGQLRHASADAFATELRNIWLLSREVATDRARIIVRFGGINDRAADPLDIVRDSFAESGWKLQTIVTAGEARADRRQANMFMDGVAQGRSEYDIWGVAR